tara:strand:- start:684 stop:911 length:228 start_codon:yes stop_codon:yes gene_type:complete
MTNGQKKIHKIATITGSDNAENIVVVHREYAETGLLDLELYTNINLQKCFDWIDQRYSLVGNDGNYDLMIKKGAV